MRYHNMGKVSQPTSGKGSASHKMITELEPGTFNKNRHPYEARNQNKNAGQGGGQVFSLYKPTRSSKEPSKGRASNGYESPSSAAWAPILKENQQQTRNQGGNAAKSGEKNRTPSRYQPLTDLNEMRSMRDHARRIKNNSQYASSTQP